MRYLSLCSGIEAATVAWHPMGWEPAAFAEIEAFPAAVLKHHYPNTPNLGDMTKWREWNVGSIDLLVGGTPCQSFSVAGLRKGLSDPRGGLMLTFLEIAQSLRPRWVVWENVPGVLSSGGGRDFGSFLGALGELGYGWAYRVLDAQWCRVDGYERAVPQRRRRVFVVGCLGDATSAAQVLFERQSVERNPAPRGKARQGAAADAEDGARTGGCYWDGSDCAATLTKKNAGGEQRMPDKANFGAVLQPVVGSLCADDAKQIQQKMVNQQKFVVETRCFAGSSFARYDESQSASTIRREGGDLGGGSETFVAVPYRKSHRAASATDDESWVRAAAANTLNRFDTGERDTHAICHLCNHSHDEDRVCQECGNDLACDTLDLCSDCLQEQAEKQSIPHAIAFTPGNLSRGAGPSQNSEVAPTQKCSAGRGADDQRTCVAFTCKDHGADAGDVAPTLRAMPHDGSHANGGWQVAVAFNWQNGGGYGNANEGLGITIKGTGPLQRCNTPAVAFKTGNGAKARSNAESIEVTPTIGANAGGNTVPAVAHTLRAEGHDASEDGTGKGVPITIAFHSTQDPINSTDGTTHAMGCWSKQGMATVGVAYPIISDADRAESIAKTPSPDAEGRVRLRNPGLGIGMSNDPMFTLQATKPHSVATQTVAPSLTASNDPSRSPQSAEVTQQIAAVHQATMVVRRLTPVECERLQGFPDDYTNIPWRGKAESPDGPRYKALGNSMAVNCMRWIGRRIDAVEKGTELPE